MVDSEHDNAFGKLLRDLRLGGGLTQEALAERAGLGRRSVQHLERGEVRPQRATARRLAAALVLTDVQRARFEELARPGPRRPSVSAGTGASWAADHSLPLPLTSFIGRSREVAEVGQLLARERLVTLTGAGGVGKTRLALAVAGDVAGRYPQGVWLAELASLAEPALVPLAVATALGLREEAGQPPTATLVTALRPRRLLLVLDNCEHLLDACAALAEALLQGCPQVQILATSREALGLGGEATGRIPSLALPDVRHVAAPEDLLQVEAVQLFVERARAAQPHFALTARNAPLVAQLCLRLDGIPLALELAAARLRGLSLEALAARLERRFHLLTGGSRTALPRQRTLRATVDWSYDLLSAPEQILFDRLAVFSGSFDLEAAEAACAGRPVAPEEVVDLLLRLVDRSLVVGEERDGEVERYRLLETLRQYGRERLAARGEAAALAARHFGHYRDVAEQAAWVVRERQQAVLDRLEAERENLRQALGWALERGEAQGGLRLGGALQNYWWLRGYFGEGRRWLGALLALPGAVAHTAARARALRCQAILHFGAGFLAGGLRQGPGERRALHAEALAIAREVGDTAEQAWNLQFLGFLLGPIDYTGARALLEEGLALAAAQGDRWLVHVGLALLGAVAWVQGDRAEARHRYMQSLRESQRGGDRDGYARALWFLASMTFQEGEVATARRDLEESLAVYRELHDRMGVTVLLGALGVVAASQGDGVRAGACFAEKRALWEQVGERSGIASALRDLGWLARREGDAAQARVCFAEALGLERELGDAAGMAASLAGLGDVARDQGDSAQAAARYVDGLAQLRGSEAGNERAACLEGLAAVAWAGGDAARVARLFGAAAAARLPNITITPASPDGYAEVVAATRAALGEEAYAAAWAEGRALSLDAAVTLALEGQDQAPEGE